MSQTWARGFLALVVLAGGLGPVLSSARAADVADEQRRRLASGEVIVRPDMPPGASESARGGTALAFVRASPEEVWRILTDYPGHTRYYPRVVAAEVVEADARRVLVRYQVAVGPLSSVFHMNKFPDPRRRRIVWQLADGHSTGLFRENSGYWQVDETAGGSLVTYAIAVRTVLPGFLTRGSEQDSLTETVTALRKLAEESRGAR